jgi:hypothetical protein
MTTRKPSRVSADEMALLHSSLEAMFHKFKDGSGITRAGCVKFAKNTGLLDAKLSEANITMIFAGVKLGQKEELSYYGRFQEAVRKMAQKKEVTYQEFIQSASSSPVMSESVDPVPSAGSFIVAGGEVAREFETGGCGYEQSMEAVEKLGQPHAYFDVGFERI